MADPSGKNYINKNYQRKKSGITDDASEILRKLTQGNRALLARAITLTESEHPDDAVIAKEILKQALPLSGNSQRIGITGVPGAGKSTFIEAFGTHLTSIGKKVAVLTIDPTSSIHKGSILGDKTRMNLLSSDPNAFIRPSPSVGTLGGVARKTRESIILCEAAGYDTILVETVGVGQSETEVHSMTDLFILLMIAGAGDELQGIKRGIMEMADILVINKDDGENKTAAKKARSEYSAALHLFPPSESGWNPTVVTCSSTEKTGIPEIYNLTINYFQHIKSNGYYTERRKRQSLTWMHQSVMELIRKELFLNPEMRSTIKELEKNVTEGARNPYEAAETLLKIFKNTGL